MDVSKIQKLATPTGPFSDRTRITLLVILTLVIIALFFYFQNLSMKQQQELDVDPETLLDTPPAVREVYAKVDPALLTSVRDGTPAERVVKESEPYSHLINEAAKLIPGDMELLDTKLADPKAILADPAAFRGKPLEIKGNIQYFGQDTFKNHTITNGYLTTLEGDTVYFTVLNMPESFMYGGVMKLRGFFFKLFSFTLPDEMERISSNALFFVGNRLVPSFYSIDPVTSLDFDLLEVIADMDPESATRDFQEKQLYHLLSYVVNMDEETKKGLEYIEKTPSEVIPRSFQNRGKPLDIVGYVKWLRMRQLGPEGENPLGLKNVHHGVAANFRGGLSWCYFIAPELPEWLDINDFVHLKGIFFRNYIYTNQRGHPTQAPVLIITDIEEFVIPEDESIAYLQAIFLGMAVLMLGFFVLILFRDRKKSKELHARFIEKKKKQLAKAMSEVSAGSEGAEAPGSDG